MARSAIAERQPYARAGSRNSRWSKHAGHASKITSNTREEITSSRIGGGSCCSGATLKLELESLTNLGHSRDISSKAAEQFVEFVSRVEIGFEFAGAELVAEFIEAAREKIQSRGEHFLIGQNDVAPR